MGNQQSKSTAVSDVLNKATTNVLLTNSNNCAQNNSQRQSILLNNIDLRGTGCSLNISGIHQDATQMPNFSCSAQASNDADLMTKLQTAIDQEAQSKVSGMGGAINSESVSKSVTKLKNIVSTNLKVSNLSQCVQNNMQSQEQVISNIFSGCPLYCNTGCQSGYDCDTTLCKFNINDLGQVATQKAVASCLTENTNIAQAIQDISSDLKQKVASSNTGIDIMALLGSWMIPLIICIVSIFLISIGIMFMPEGKSTELASSASMLMQNMKQ